VKSSNFTCLASLGVYSDLLGKWLCRYAHLREALWRAVVYSKYCSAWGEWCSNEVHGLYGVRLWKNIKRVGGSFLVILDLRWVTAQKLDSGMTYGVEIKPSR